MLPYVEKNWRPERDTYIGWNLSYRLKSAGFGLAQLVTGVADGVLGIACFPLAAVSKAGSLEWEKIEQRAVKGFPTLNKTLPKVYKSFLVAVNPDAPGIFAGNFLQIPELTALVTGPMIRKIEELGKTKDNNFDSEVLSRLLAVATTVTSVAVLALDLAGGVLLATASFLSLGKFEKLNEAAYHNLFLGLGEHQPMFFFMPLAMVINPRI